MIIQSVLHKVNKVSFRCATKISPSNNAFVSCFAWNAIIVIDIVEGTVFVPTRNTLLCVCPLITPPRFPRAFFNVKRS